MSGGSGVKKWRDEKAEGSSVAEAPTHPRPLRGGDRTGRGRIPAPLLGGVGGWVGPWNASFRFCACIGTMNRDEAAAGALASWTAAVLCRFCARGPDPKAPEDWRTPKPGGTAAGSWKAAFRFCACIGTMNLKCISPCKSTNVFSGSWRAWKGEPAGHTLLPEPQSQRPSAIPDASFNLELLKS